MAAARKALHAQTSSSSSEYLRSSPAGMVAIVVGWICLAASVFMVGRYFIDSGWVRWPLLAGTTAFALVAAGMMFSAGTATVRTAEGRDLWSRTGGFARFLTTDSSEARFDASAHLDWYPRYLAWAVALGVADEWAARYEAQGVELPEVPWVIWVGSGQRFSTRVDDPLVRPRHLQRIGRVRRVAGGQGQQQRRRLLGRVRWRRGRRGLVVSHAREVRGTGPGRPQGHGRMWVC